MTMPTQNPQPVRDCRECAGWMHGGCVELKSRRALMSTDTTPCELAKPRLRNANQELRDWGAQGQADLEEAQAELKDAEQERDQLQRTVDRLEREAA